MLAANARPLLGHILQPRLDAGLVVGVRLQNQRASPLILRLDVAAGIPVGVAQMAGDAGILRLQLGRLFQQPKRRLGVALAQLYPAQTIAPSFGRAFSAFWIMSWAKGRFSFRSAIE